MLAADKLHTDVALGAVIFPTWVIDVELLNTPDNVATSVSYSFTEVNFVNDTNWLHPTILILLIVVVVGGIEFTFLTTISFISIGLVIPSYIPK